MAAEQAKQAEPPSPLAAEQAKRAEPPLSIRDVAIKRSEQSPPVYCMVVYGTVGRCCGFTAPTPWGGGAAIVLLRPCAAEPQHSHKKGQGKKAAAAAAAAQQQPSMANLLVAMALHAPPTPCGAVKKLIL